MDTALIQTFAAGTIVAGAAFFLGRRAWRALGATRRGKADGASCAPSGPCGCGNAPRAAPEAEGANTGARS